MKTRAASPAPRRPSPLVPLMLPPLRPSLLLRCCCCCARPPPSPAQGLQTCNGLSSPSRGFAIVWGLGFSLFLLFPPAGCVFFECRALVWMLECEMVCVTVQLRLGWRKCLVLLCERGARGRRQRARRALLLLRRARPRSRPTIHALALSLFLSNAKHTHTQSTATTTTVTMGYYNQPAAKVRTLCARARVLLSSQALLSPQGDSCSSRAPLPPRRSPIGRWSQRSSRAYAVALARGRKGVALFGARGAGKKRERREPSSSSFLHARPRPRLIAPQSPQTPHTHQQ